MPKSPSNNKQPAEHARLLSQAAALEELGPSKLAQRGILLVVGLVALAAGASAFVPVITSASAKGMVAPTGSYSAIRHLNGGVVEQVMVAEGDLVARNALILRLQGAEQRKQLDALEAEYFALAIEEERLRAATGAREPDFSRFPAKYARLVGDQEAIFKQNVYTLEQRRQALLGRASHAEAEVEVYRSRLAGHRRQEKLLRSKFFMYARLRKKQLVSRLKYIGVEQELQTTRNEIVSTGAQIQAAKKKLAEAWASVAEFVATERQSALDRLSAVSGRLAELTEDRERLQAHIDYLDVRAPVAGVVNNLKILSPGSVVSPADVIADIVPQGVPFVVEARVPPKEIGFLELGQEARLIVDGFDVSRFQALSGRLTGISATALLDQDGSYYVPIRITMDANRLSDGRLSYELRAGMGVQASVVTGEQSLMAYLLRPVHASLSRVFSER